MDDAPTYVHPPPARRATVATNAPGLLLVAIGVAAAYLISSLVPVASALIVTVALGVLARNSGLAGDWALPGTKLATRELLRAGVVLLGLQLAVGQVLELPSGVLLVVALTVAVTFAATLAAGRLLGVSVSRGTTLLVATGFSICGASAAAAMDAVSESDEEDLATAAALVTIFGGAALFCLPMLYGPLGLDSVRAGTWAGASVHEVAQVVAAASPAGAIALGRRWW